MQRFGGVPLVGRRPVALGDAEDARAGRDQHRAHRACRTGAPTSAASYPTAEFTGELFVRWFQFGAFCPLFRSHGRNWQLRLPWGWNGGDGGPDESQQLHAPIPTRAAQRAGRADLPEVPGAALSADAVSLHAPCASARHGPADHARDVAALSRRRRRGRRAATSTCGARHARGAGGREGRHVARRVSAARTRGIDFWTEEPSWAVREIERAVDLATTAALRSRRRGRSRWGR